MLADVLQGIAEAASLADACSRLSAFGVGHLGADVAGVLRKGRRGGWELVAATDPVVGRVEAARAAAGEARGTPPVGPGQSLLLRELGGDPGAPAWQFVATHLGLRSALVLGLPALAGGAAVLALYARAPDAFAARSLPAAVQAGWLAGTVLREAERRLNLEEALHTRGVIGQAQGVLMERYALTSDQAMSYLRRHSQETHQPIRDLAGEVVGRREAESLARTEGPAP